MGEVVEREVIPGEPMTSSRWSGLPDDSCRPRRRGAGHRAAVGLFHCRLLKLCQFAQIAPFTGILNRDWVTSRRSNVFFARVWLR